uniref:Specifically androgen-regulated gene protein-like n=1 Tax=Fundulus heteroclitus TaxID=8078 RepID=A0A3Q2P703_FUNHE
MSKSGTWPGNVAMEPLNNMDSAGSCDSVISTNSVWSEDSMEHLSAEEKACLMYLEETIEALEMQEDSGISNDEPEPQDQLRRNDVPTETLVSGSHEVSTPAAHTPADRLLTGLTAEREAERHAANQNYKPQPASFPVVGMKDANHKADPPVFDAPAGYTVTPSDKTTEGPKFNGDPDSENCAEASGSDLAIIPPPTDFMDEQDADFMDEQDADIPPETMTVAPPPANGSTKQKPTVVLEQMHLRASLKKGFGSSPAAEESPDKPSEVASLLPQMSAPSEFSEPRSPPAVAPKPKKLPSNIVLKSQKTPTPVSHGSPGHTVPTHSDRMLLDPQKVRMEALRKLGLLKDNKEESSPVVSPKIPLTSAAYRGSQSHSPPVSPAAPHTPPITRSPVNSHPPALAAKTDVSAPDGFPSAASASPLLQDAAILPAPAAFSDAFGPPGNEAPAVTEATFSTPSNTPSALLKQLTPPKVSGLKSATLERSGLGLSSQMFGQNLSESVSGEQDPKHLRNSRPRPASLGNGQDFSRTKGEGLAASRLPDSQKPLSAQAFHNRESAKLPRSQGISVLICPRAENEEDRREALKKLGLLRD